jgi:hypothetical protein
MTLGSSEGEIALAEQDRVRAANVRCNGARADACGGGNAAFCRGLHRAVGVSRTRKVYYPDAQLISSSGCSRHRVQE